MSVLSEPNAYRWSRDEFYALAEKGFFSEHRVELLNGEIVAMPPQLNHHAAGIELTRRALEKAFGAGYWIRVQNSLDLTSDTVLDPDLAVIPGDPAQSVRANPTTALLVVEVSDSSLRYDRSRKMSLYARAGIADYWIVNLIDRRLEVFRRPIPDTTTTFGFGYQDRSAHELTEHVSPLAAAAALIAVGELFP